MAQAPFDRGVDGIIAMSTQKKVSGIDAGAIIAAVTNEKVSGIKSSECQPGKAVRKRSLSPTDMEIPVLGLAVERTVPKPAAGHWLREYSIHEALKQGFARHEL